MKILICTRYFETRSNGASLFPNLVLKINELYPQHEVRVLTTDARQSYDKVIKVSFKYPRIVLSFYTLLNNFGYYRALKKVKKDFDFDILIFNEAGAGVWSKLFLSKKIKIMGMIHDGDSMMYELHDYLKTKHFLINWVKSKLEIRAIKNLDVILCPSNFIKNLILTNIDTDKAKIELLYQGIDMGKIEFKPKQSNFQQPIKILFVKSAFIRGGLFDLLDSLKSLKEYQFLLTIVGSDAALVLKVKEKTVELKHVETVLRGYCPPKTVSELMYENDIFCVPSKAEILGLGNIEALAHGTLVVSTAVGGIPEVLKNGENGWLAQPNNPQSLAQAIKNCVESDPSVLEAKKLKGRQFIEQNFDYKRMLERLLSIAEGRHK